MATYSADVAVAWALKQVGSTSWYRKKSGGGYQNYCQGFVADCYAKATGKRISAGSAKEARQKWMVSSSRTNIPIGAAVYFSSSSIYGHVGMYIGDGKYIHAAGSSGVKVSKIADSSRYLGWGWNGGVQLTSSKSGTTANVSLPSETNAPTSVVSVQGTKEEVQIFHAESPSTIRKWGTLRMFEQIKTPSEGEVKASKLLQLYNRKSHTLNINDAFGDGSVRAGTLLPVKLNLGDILLNNYMMVEKVTHKFSKDKYTMDLTLEGYYEDY